jgi:hypothetical protein
MNFLDTLLRDSPGEEKFTPAAPPAFLAAPEPPRVPPHERELALRTLPELLTAPSFAPPFAGVDFLTALIFRSRPLFDPDRFTRGLELVPSSGEPGDPFPVLF